MAKITQSTLDFLIQLKDNNNRDWFNENKKRYELAKKEFEDFVDELIGRIALFDPSIMHQSAKDCVFRIYRDVRFSHDKSPYKTHFGAHITAAKSRSEIHSRAGYYIHVEPKGESMLAGGAYFPDSPWLKEIRKEIHYNGDDFRKILDNKTFIEYFGGMEGDKLKTVPKGYSSDNPEIELLKHKSFMAVHKCDDKKIVGDGFLDHCSAVFKALHPFDRFLNEAADLQ